MLAAFLQGYHAQALRHGGSGLAGWRDWLVARRGKECQHAWPGQVLHIALPGGWRDMGESPQKDEQYAIKILFQLLDEFAAEQEDLRRASTERVDRDEADALAVPRSEALGPLVLLPCGPWSAVGGQR